MKSVNQNLTELWMRLGRNYNNGKHLDKQHRHLIQSLWSYQVQQIIVPFTYRQRLAPNLAHHIPNTSTRDKWQQKAYRGVEMNSLATVRRRQSVAISSVLSSIADTALGLASAELQIIRQQQQSLVQNIRRASKGGRISKESRLNPQATPA
jgi:hypothetical protein